MKINNKYLPLWTDQEYDTAVISGGRGSGKSYGAQVFICDLSYEAGHKIAVTRFTMASAQKSIIPEFKEKLEILKSPYADINRIEDFDIKSTEAVNLHSKTELFFMGLKSGSGQQTAKLKSITNLTTLLIEEGEEIPDDGTEFSASTYDKIEDSIRTMGVRLRKIIIWNPSDKYSYIYKRFFSGKGPDEADLPTNYTGKIGKTLYIYTSYLDNSENLADIFLEKAEKTKNANPGRYNHIYMGEPLSDVEGALWRLETMISPYRIPKTDIEKLQFTRIVTAVDPSVSDDKGDECGIVTCAMDNREPAHFYVISDESGQYTNRQWAQVAIGEYKKYNSDSIIAEKNQGGDLVKMNLHNIDSMIEPKLIHAKKSKIARAEPVAGLYEAGRVHHIGRFPELEQEMTTYDGTGPSPNRYDSLTYAITELSQGKIVPLRIRSL